MTYPCFSRRLIALNKVLGAIDLSVMGLRLLASASITLRSVRFMRSPKWKMEFFLFEYFLHYGLLDSLYYTIA